MTICFPRLRIRRSPFIAGLLAIFVIADSISFAANFFDETTCVTLFAFDQAAIPHSQNLRLEMRAPTKYPGNPVVARGLPGTPDAMGVQFYGSVIREKNQFRMWYVAFDDDVESKVATARWRAAYAESSDGIRWTKPNLGLVKFNGSTDNNLILTEPTPFGFVNLKVLSEPKDPDPKQRFKISTHIYFRHNTRLGSLAPFVSEDGLTWKLVSDAKPDKAELKKGDLFLPAVHFEPSGGLYKWNGMYYISGQNAMNATRTYQGRVARTYRSSDFRNWSQTSSISFIRPSQNTYLGSGRSLEGEQTHEGISVWNRRNVLLGIYGRWHGAKEWKDITIDLGFLVSNDGLQFREPAHEWTFLERGKDGQWDQGGLLQGQGFENIDDQTLIYYGAWDPREKNVPRGGVGIATLPRDRFAALVVETIGQGPEDYQLPVVTSEFVTALVPIKTDRDHRFYLNGAGLGREAKLRIELLDEFERPLPNFSGDHAAIIEQSGFQVPILWNGKVNVQNIPDQIRFRVTFEGARNTDIRFSAIYVRDGRAE